MKKYLLTITILIITTLVLTMFINTHVYAVGTDHKIIYDIENFRVDENTITFEGWAFVNNVHNNYNGNTAEITIKAYSNNKSISGITTKKTNNEVRDKALYLSKCHRRSASSGGGCIESYEQATCRGDGSCHYDDAGFISTFSINELTNKFNKDEKITFEICGKVYNNNGEVLQKPECKDVAVSTEASNVNSGDKIYGTSATIDISGISNVFVTNVELGRVLDREENHKYASNFYWQNGGKYPIIDKANAQKWGYPELKMYELSFRKSGQYAQPPESSTSGTGWVYASWGEVLGNVTIKLEDPIPTTGSCPPSSYNGSDDLRCNETGIYEEVTNVQIEKIDQIDNNHPKYNEYRKLTDDENGQCTKEVTREIIGSASITQNGKAIFDLDDSEVISGTRFGFTVGYSGEAEYEFCKNDAGSNFLQYRIKEQRWNENTSTCQEIITGIYNITNEENNPDEWEVVTKYMQGLLAEPAHNAKAYSYDSNTVNTNGDDGFVDMDGKWTNTYTDNTVGDNGHWEPGEKITYQLNFELAHACIELNEPFDVNYYIDGSCNTEKEKDGGFYYYIPLKQPTTTIENFPVKVEIDDVNVLGGDNVWPINYLCGVDCKQELYDPNGGFAFIYRPVNLTQPDPTRPNNTIFPGYILNPYTKEQDSNSTRNIGDNWKLFVKDDDAIDSKLNRNTLEYEINLTQNDIRQIKKSNKGKKYTSLGTITNKGKSTFFADENLNHIFALNANNYNALGECTNECWTYDALYEGGAE